VNNGSLFHLLRFVRGSRAGGELIAALMLLAAIGYLAKRRAAPLCRVSFSREECFCCRRLPIPWYFTWSIPFL